MTQANDSILVTPGSGATVATHLAAGKEYQVVMQAGPDGHLIDSRDAFVAYYTETTNAASREVAELFNASSTVIVRVRGIWIVPSMTAITGVQIGFDINKTSAVGTGGTSITPRQLDSNFGALPAGITAAFGSTAGATLNFLFWKCFFFNDETNSSTGFVAYQNQLPSLGRDLVEIVLRLNQGVQIKQSVAATVGLTGAIIYFVVE